MASSSREQQQQQLFSSLPATPSRTSTAGLPSNMRLSTPAHLAGLRAFSMFPGTLQLPGSPARTPTAAAAAPYQLGSANGLASQPGHGILSDSTACGADARHMQPASPAWSVYQTPSAPDEPCFASASSQPASSKGAHVQAACTQTSPTCDSSSKPAAQQSPQPSPWTEWWRGLEGGAAAAGHSHSPAVRPRVLFCQEGDSAAGASPAAAAQCAAEDLASPASFPFGCGAVQAGSKETQQGAQGAPAGCQQAGCSLSPISLASEDADLQHADHSGDVAPSPAWSVHTNWAALGHEEEITAGGLRSMAEAAEAAASAGASVSPESCAGSSRKTSAVLTEVGAAPAVSRAGCTQERQPLQPVTNTQVEPHAQPAAAQTPSVSSIDGLEGMSRAEAVTALSQLAQKLKVCIDQAASAGLTGGVAPVISRGDLGMIVPSPIAARGGSAVGRWQQGAMSNEQ
jgi:hypothetical protein